MQTGKRILAFLLALVLVASCIPASSIHADAAVITAPTMTTAADISTHVTSVLTYFHAENLATYKEWLAILEADGTYTDAIARLSAGIAKLDAGYTFYDDGQLLGNYLTNGYEPTYYAETVTYYTTVSAPSGKVITLHKDLWTEHENDTLTAAANKVTFHWDETALAHVKVEYSDSVGGSRTEVTCDDAVTWTANTIVLFFTVTLNKANDNKPEFLGAMVGDGLYNIEISEDGASTTDNTTDEVKYLRQGMLIEDYKMAPYKLDQTDSDSNLNSAYQVVWGGLESTRGDVTALDGGGTIFSVYGKRVNDTPYAIGLGASQPNGNGSLVINAYNVNSVDIYGVTTPQTVNGNNINFYNNTAQFGFNLISHSSNFRSQYASTSYNAVNVNDMMAHANNWITLADASTYTQFWGKDDDVAQIVPAGNTISEFALEDVDFMKDIAIIYDYTDPYNYAYLTYQDTNTMFVMYRVVNGVKTDVANTGISAKSGTTAIDPSIITYKTGYDSNTTLYYAGGRYICGSTSYSICNMQDITFSWNSEKNCYDLTFENWPLVSYTNEQLENSTDMTDEKYFVKGYAPRTVSLATFTTGNQLTNLYLSLEGTSVGTIRASEEDLTPGATQKLYGAISVKTQGHDHHYVAYTGAADASLEVTPKTCYSYATYYGVCSICGQSSAGEAEPATFEYGLDGYAEHTWSETYNYSAAQHWQECIVCAAHDKVTANTAADHDTLGTDGACSVCGFNTLLDGAKSGVENTVYFVKDNLATYKSWQSQLESEKAADYYAAAYNRVTNAIEKLEAGYTFVDDGTHVANYQTVAGMPADSGVQTYYTTLTESDTLSFSGKVITLYQENFAETDMNPAVPAEGTSIYWANEAWTVEYSTDGGATKTALTSGQNISISGSVILYVTIAADENLQRKFVGLSVDSDLSDTAFDVKVFRQQMKLTRGIHAPYELDENVDSSGSAYQVIWGGLEATRYYPTYGTNNENFYDYPTAITFSEDAGISFNKLGGIRGTYVGTVGTGSDASTCTTNTVYQKNVLLTCSTSWQQGLNNTNTETINNLLYKVNMLTLADKASYDAYYGVDSNVMQVIPQGEVIQKFSLSVNGSQYPKIIFNYVDADNYTCVQFNDYSNNPISVWQMTDGVCTILSGNMGLGSWGGLVAISGGEYDGHMYGSARMLTHGTYNAYSQDVPLTFTWNAEDGCYDLTFEKWPVVEAGSYSNNWGDGASTTWGTVIGYTTRTVSLKSWSSYATKLTNIYIGGKQINDGSATITLNSLAISSVAEAHVCTPKDGTWYSDGASHYQLCSCGLQVKAEACTAGSTYTTANGMHSKSCTVCGNAVNATMSACSGDRIHADGEHYTICSTCNVEIEGSRATCGTGTGGWQQENDRHWVTYECGDAVEKTACSGTEYKTENGTHQLICATCGNTYGSAVACSGTVAVSSGDATHKLKCAACGETYGEDIACSAQGDIIQGEGEHWYECACGNIVDKEACTAGSEYGKDETHHWQLCVDCGQIAGGKVEHTYEEGTATYDHGNLCVCGADDGNVLTRDYLPTILGSKILKASKATDQKLRIDVDFTDLNNAIAVGSSVTEYGVIVAPLAGDVYSEDAATNYVNVDYLKSLYGNSKYTITSTASLGSQVSERILSVGIKIPAADYGKRIALIAYVKVDGVIYYSENNNSNVGLVDGVINTGVMRVMKAILKDTSAYGYANIYATAATTYYVEYAQYVEGYDAAAVIELINKYLNGDIVVDGEGYEDARNATMYVFHYSMYIYAQTGNAAPSAG